jgi:hypothetical protein
LDIEGSDLLYLGNIFVFYTRGKDPYTHHRGIHSHDVFNKNTHLISGFPNRDGRPATSNQTSRAIDAMFDKDIFHGLFSHRDPMMVFMRKIGRENASNLISIKMEGFFLEIQKIIPDINSNAPSDSLVIFSQSTPFSTTSLRTFANWFFTQVVIMRCGMVTLTELLD